MSSEVTAVPAGPPTRSGHGVAYLADRLTAWIDTALGLGLMASVLLNCANVAGRYVFGVALVGADELMIYGMVATIFLGCVSVTWRNAHLRLDVLVEGMPPRVRAIARRASDLVLAIVCGTIGIQSAAMAWDMAEFDQRSLAANLPMVVPHGAVAVGLLLMAAMALIHVVSPPPLPLRPAETAP